MSRSARSGRPHLIAAALAIVLAVSLAPSAATGDDARARYRPGAAGVGDPYFPKDGNGGYDVRRYSLRLRYDPAPDRLAGRASILARATHDLSRFNLDFDGLKITSIRVAGRPAAWRRDAGELIVTPRAGLRAHRWFRTVVRYHGVPETIQDAFGASGFFHTDDGTVVAGEPHVASYWFPANDHPTDKAAFKFRISVPRGLKAIANGVLERRRLSARWSTWVWRAAQPMAPYLATATIGEFDLHAYRRDGLPYWDAIDSDLLAPPAVPRTGEQYAISLRSEPSYKRLSRRIAVPAGGARLSFWIERNTEPEWDFAFVEARTVGANDWTTLRDANGHTSKNAGFSCPYWLDLHPFLRHYQKARANGTCRPEGTTGRWWAATGESAGWERWAVDLSRYAGSTARVSIAYASDDSVQYPGVFVDDIVVSTGAGSTSFEDDGNVWDGWSPSGPPRSSPPNPNDWVAGTVEQAPPSPGLIAKRSLRHQDEIITFLARSFGSYPFRTAGGIVDDEDRLGFALEIQTRPVYPEGFFYNLESGDGVVVHELAHQWYGDSLALRRWRHIWLNEGFATYAEWLWSEHEGIRNAGQIFRDLYSIPRRDPFWSLTIGDPGKNRIFDFAVYARGAMTLHRLRVRVGDHDFFQILRRWAASREGGAVTTGQLRDLAERVSGEQLDRLFHEWLFTARKPTLGGRLAAGDGPRNTPPTWVRKLLGR